MTDKRYPTRMHEVLGVGVDEEATYKSTTKELKEFRFFVDEYGSPRYPSRLLLDSYDMANIINHPERITRRPRLTEEQEYVLKALYVAFDFKWVAKKEDGQVMAFEDKPQKHKDYFSGETQWYCGEGEEEKDYGWKVKPSSPICGLVSWSDPKPLDIVQTLRDAGCEIEGVE